MSFSTQFETHLTELLILGRFFGPFILVGVFIVFAWVYKQHSTIQSAKNFTEAIDNDDIRIISMIEYEFTVTSLNYVYPHMDNCVGKEVCVTYKNKAINKKIQRKVSVEVGKSIKKGDIYPFFEIKYQHPDGSITTKFKYPSLNEQENYQRYLARTNYEGLYNS